MEERKSDVRRSQRFGRAVFHLAPILVLCALWLPILRAYYVPGTNVSHEMVQQALESPSNSVLEELKDFNFLGTQWTSQHELVDTASQLLQGEVRFQGCSTRITMPFSPQDLNQVPSGCELELAGFFVPDVLLEAYEASGREEFLTAAEAFIVNAQEYERSAFLPRGAFWNDHAVAARVGVLANFWRLYRHSPKYRPEVGRQVLQMVARSQQLLAKSDQFTYATNHGIMQNLALWHASLAFPSLPRTQEYQRLAFARMNEQMKFYVDEEGFILEHSAGYQAFGLRLLGWAFRYLDLMHRVAPQEWIEKYDQARKVYATLRRPDGSLPIFGDTGTETDPLGPPVTTFDQGRVRRLASEPGWKPAEPVNMYPVSGYSVWWDGLEFWPYSPKLSQTVITWSNFSGHGHKHADEMSLVFWAGGHNWINNVGYWPYDSDARQTAESWAGSNAPHQVGEDFASSRATKLVSSGQSGKLVGLELERAGVDHYVARRQVIQCKPNLWVVLDDSSGAQNNRTNTTWTVSSAVRLLQQPAEGSFVLEVPGSTDHLHLFALGSQGTVQRVFRGSSHPFAGWQVEGGVPVPAFALEVEQPVNNSWAATIWSTEEAATVPGFAGLPRMTHWTSATDWEIQFPARTGEVALQRQGNTLQVHSEGEAGATLELVAAPNIAPRLAELDRQFAATASQYHHFYGNEAKRTKITYLLISIFLLQQIFFLIYQRMHASGLDTLKCLTVIAWVIGGIWLVGFNI